MQSLALLGAGFWHILAVDSMTEEQVNSFGKCKILLSGNVAMVCHEFWWTRNSQFLNLSKVCIAPTVKVRCEPNWITNTIWKLFEVLNIWRPLIIIPLMTSVENSWHPLTHRVLINYYMELTCYIWCWHVVSSQNLAVNMIGMTLRKLREEKRLCQCVGSSSSPTIPNL